MENDVKIQINKIISIFQNSKEIKEMIFLKEKLLNNNSIRSKLEEYKLLISNPYDKKCIELKNELLSNKDFKKYKLYEEELFFLILKINKLLKELSLEKSCMK